MKSEKDKKTQHGFSIIELIIVVLIVAILAVISIPSIQGNLRLLKLETGSGRISSLLTMARLEALKRNREVTVEFDKTKREVNIKSKNYRNEEIDLSKKSYLPDDIIILDNAPNSVTFTSLGRNKTNGVTTIPIQLKGTIKKKQIKVSAIGVITTNNY